MTTSQLPPRWMRRQLNRAAAYHAAETPLDRLAAANGMVRAALHRTARVDEPLACTEADAIAEQLVAHAARLDGVDTPGKVIRHAD